MTGSGMLLTAAASLPTNDRITAIAAAPPMTHTL